MVGCDESAPHMAVCPLYLTREDTEGQHEQSKPEGRHCKSHSFNFYYVQVLFSSHLCLRGGERWKGNILLLHPRKTSSRNSLGQSSNLAVSAKTNNFSLSREDFPTTELAFLRLTRGILTRQQTRGWRSKDIPAGRSLMCNKSSPSFFFFTLQDCASPFSFCSMQ